MSLYGVDISKWQGVGAGDEGADFVICKATEGVGYVDSSCDAHYQRAKARGQLLGVYHFARPDSNAAKAEAQFFVKNIQGYIGEAILILDYEVAPYSDDWAREFMDEVYRLTGVYPLLYANASTINGNNWSKTAQVSGLWIAGYPNRYNVQNPPKPSAADMPYGIGAWPFWAIWQYTSSAGTLDRDIANMDREAWRKYAARNGQPAPAPQPTPQPSKKSIDELAKECIAGKWGNGYERKTRLKKAGYDYEAVQARVNELMGANKTYYTVKAGDTLSGIAAKYGTTWQAIYEKNKGIIGSNPNIIKPGQRLEI